MKELLVSKSPFLKWYEEQLTYFDDAWQRHLSLDEERRRRLLEPITDDPDGKV